MSSGPLCITYSKDEKTSDRQNEEMSIIFLKKDRYEDILQKCQSDKRQKCGNTPEERVLKRYDN